jgi:hypothetical protein
MHVISDPERIIRFANLNLRGRRASLTILRGIALVIVNKLPLAIADGKQNGKNPRALAQ